MNQCKSGHQTEIQHISDRIRTENLSALQNLQAELERVSQQLKDREDQNLTLTKQVAELKSQLESENIRASSQARPEKIEMGESRTAQSKPNQSADG